ncbi:MAG TPA: hypothetical protein VL172_06760 [Kofleriaceae bacterium]|nr:hypothetical protein [Kofleriaceae bacterium]
MRYAAAALAGLIGCGGGGHPEGPTDSDLGAFPNGGGCYPTYVDADQVEQFSFVNPEWAAVEEGTAIDSAPVLVHGTVEQFIVSRQDFPASHLAYDAVPFLRLDEEDAWRLGTGNLTDEEDGIMEIEWEAGAWPDWAWPGPGDRLAVMGRWIFDCGHPGGAPGTCSATTDRPCVIDDDCRPPRCPDCGADETCAGEHFGYSTEIHPPHAAASIRLGRGGQLVDGGPAQPVSRADIYVSADGGPAGDRCTLTHVDGLRDFLFSVECFPLDEPVAQVRARDFVFDLPLPPRPEGAGPAIWRVIEQAAPGGSAAELQVSAHEDGAAPHLTVTVKTTGGGAAGPPTGFAGTLLAGWSDDATPLTHVRVTFTGVVVHDPLQPAVPVVREVHRWSMIAAVDGEWRQLPGLDEVTAAEQVIDTDVTIDQFLPAGGALRVLADGAAYGCIDTMMGKSFATDLTEMPLTDAVDCLQTSNPWPGTVDISYPGPDFGAGDHETPSSGGDSAGGQAYSLRYRIELP